MTLLSYKTSAGRQGRCDANCYEGKGAICHCICGGANHGKGIEAAFKQTLRQAGEWVKAFEEKHVGEIVRFGGIGSQMEMFEEVLGENFIAHFAK